MLVDLLPISYCFFSYLLLPIFYLSSMVKVQQSQDKSQVIFLLMNAFRGDFSNLFLIVGYYRGLFKRFRSR